MKNVLLLLFVIFLTINNNKARAQGGIIKSVAGCYSCITSTAEGFPATLAGFSNISGISTDTSGNACVSEWGGHKVRRAIKATNTIFTIAGDGISGFSGDGGPATMARLNNPDGIFIDATNNLYIADAGNNRIRKVNLATEIISTVAGGGVSTADGVPGTTANLTAPRCVYVDASGSIYTGSGNKIRKIDGTTGLISTIAGNGAGVDTGDGRLAIAAGIAGPVRSIWLDAAGNVYFTTNPGICVRKIDIATGIITTVAGGGVCTQDGVLAQYAQLSNMHSCVVDHDGNLILADKGRKLIRMVQATTGKIFTIAGGGSILTDNSAALTAYTNAYMLYMDRASANLYYTDSTGWARKMTYSSAGVITHVVPGYGRLLRDSFSVSIAKQCNGPVITVTISNYNPSHTIKTWFGDGQSTVTPVTTTCMVTGLAVINHTYANSGTYTIKQILYNGSTALDSTVFTYQHTLCNDIKLNLYVDLNNNCTQDTTDVHLFQNAKIEIDSNGVPVDTLSAISCAYYRAYGSVGTVYSYRLLPTSVGLYVSCPAIGTIIDTLQAITFNQKSLDFGLSCTTGTTDLKLFCTRRAGVHAFLNDVLITSSSCSPISTTITAEMSHRFDVYYTTVPTSTISNKVFTINLGTLFAVPRVPYHVRITGAIIVSPSLMPRDTVHGKFTLNPIVGDIYPPDNYDDGIDTVKVGFDPNFIEVTPKGMVSAGTQLEYGIHFENTGNDTAFNIYVMDTLDAGLDPNTLNILAASAKMDFTLIKTGAYTIAKFDFPNINLLDSSHHNQCTGVFMYNIRTRAGLPDGTIIPNHAGIFFDYNEAVLTDTAITEIGHPVAVTKVANNNRVIIYPNPANDEVTITADPTTYTSFSLTNTMGQVVNQQIITDKHTKLNVAQLPAGIYYIALKGDQANKVEKFVKW